MYACICTNWKLHSPFPSYIEININVGCWIQQIEMEDHTEHCKVCNMDGHSKEACLIGPKGKTVEASMEIVATKFVEEENKAK